MILYKWADPVRIKPTDGKLLSVKYSTFACVNKKKKIGDVESISLNNLFKV